MLCAGVGDEGIEAILKINKGLRSWTPSYTQMMKIVNDLADSPEKFLDIDGIRKLLSDLASDTTRVTSKAQGSVHQILVAKWAKSKGYVIRALEKTEDVIIITASSVTKSLPRVYDLTMELGGKLFRVEAKSWKPESTLSWLKSSMRGGLIEGDKNPGQLLKDLAAIYNKRGDSNFGIKWVFDNRSPGHDLAKYRQEIIKELETGDGGKALKGLLGISDLDEWDNAVELLTEKITTELFDVI